MSFFAFNLCLLALPGSEKDRLQTIICHAVERAGRSENARKIPEEVVRKSIGDWQALGKCNDFDKSDEHYLLARGAIVCNVQLGGFAHTVTLIQRARKHIQWHENAYGAHALVFISAKLLWGCLNDDKPSFRRFSVLCAVNSILGMQREFAIIRRRMIIARPLGYNTPAILKRARRTDQKCLTVKQVRLDLDALETNGLIFRFQASRRTTYFSTRLDSANLRNAVLAQLSRKSLVMTRRQEDRRMMGLAPGPIEGHLKRIPVNEKNSGPFKYERSTGGQIETKSGLVEGPKVGPVEGPLKEMPLINVKEMPLNKCYEETRASGEGIHVMESIEGTKIQPADAPIDKCKPQPFHPPALADVNSFAQELRNNRQCPHLARQWFKKFGAEPKWTDTDWRADFARWLFFRLSKNKSDRRRRIIRAAG